MLLWRKSDKKIATFFPEEIFSDKSVKRKVFVGHL